jgi:hypothetical protein
VITSPRDGDVSKKDYVKVDGTAEAESTVDVYVNGKKAASDSAGKNGKWSVSKLSLAEGANEIRARATDAAGNTSGYSAAVTVTYETKGKKK